MTWQERLALWLVPPGSDAISDRDARARELVTLAVAAGSIYDQALMASMRSFEDVERQIRSACGHMQATIGVMQRAADNVTAIKANVKNMCDEPLADLVKEMAELGQKIKNG